ncbi:MAG: hypothetical protein M0P91_04635 [Sulfuricurvum sp.]|jgi:hypothetical protein|uniref:DUF7222 domain-containing protein n=1 Tax=Sulfuricurvum sp. TaxID=2025608 RepID=UPI0025EF6D7F|nr:hypothetical protein [Sulfuricurvum sp.]MCK9372462.1 hypothetical protein [Sulfuricurvum sp.]
MKTIEDVKNIKTNTKLEEAVKDCIIEEIETCYEDREEDFFEDLFRNGCISGMVSSLVYYTETQKFFKEHDEEINELVSETIDSIGCDSITGIFGDKFDKSDFLCLEQSNQNLLAWFGFEETARKLAQELGLDF